MSKVKVMTGSDFDFYEKNKDTTCKFYVVMWGFIYCEEMSGVDYLLKKYKELKKTRFVDRFKECFVQSIYSVEDLENVYNRIKND